MVITLISRKLLIGLTVVEFVLSCESLILACELIKQTTPRCGEINVSVEAFMEEEGESEMKRRGGSEVGGGRRLRRRASSSSSFCGAVELSGDVGGVGMDSVEDWVFRERKEETSGRRGGSSTPRCSLTLARRYSMGVGIMEGRRSFVGRGGGRGGECKDREKEGKLKFTLENEKVLGLAGVGGML